MRTCFEEICSAVDKPIIIIAFALLAISCMAFCLIMIAQKKHWFIAKSNKKGENNT